MSTTHTKNEFVGRRAELLAELFLQELEPEYLARPTTDLTYDLLAGFRNVNGGINYIAVEVKSSVRMTQDRYPIQRSKYELWANSNIPVLLLIVDVKENRLYFHWPSKDLAESSKSQQLLVHLTRIDETTKEDLRRRLVA